MLPVIGTSFYFINLRFAFLRFAFLLTEVGVDSIFTITRKPVMGHGGCVNFLHYTTSLPTGTIVLLTYGVLCCWLKWRQTPSLLQPENQIWGHWRSVNFLHSITSLSGHKLIFYVSTRRWSKDNHWIVNFTEKRQTIQHHNTSKLRLIFGFL